MDLDFEIVCLALECFARQARANMPYERATGSQISPPYTSYELRAREALERVKAIQGVITLRIWYMRDDGTFRELPHDTEKALLILRAEFVSRCSYGMLCSDKFKGVRGLLHVHGRGVHLWDEFEAEARIWLDAALGKSQGENDGNPGN